MGIKVAIALYLVALVAVIVGVDFAFFRNRFLVFAAFYLRFLRRP